jgi:hypothetical protein
MKLDLLTLIAATALGASGVAVADSCCAPGAECCREQAHTDSHA